jgi:hypothetical protein
MLALFQNYILGANLAFCGYFPSSPQVEEIWKGQHNSNIIGLHSYFAQYPCYDFFFYSSSNISHPVTFYVLLQVAFSYFLQKVSYKL